MIAAHAYPAFIASNVVDIDLFRLALRTPLPTCVFELPDEFLFLGIDADDWLVFTQKCGGFSVDVGELGITVLVPLAFVALAVGLQAVAEFVEKFGDFGGADCMTLGLEFLGQAPHAFACPAQGSLRIAARVGFDKRINGRNQCGIFFPQLLAPASRLAHPGNRLST